MGRALFRGIGVPSPNPKNRRRGPKRPLRRPQSLRLDWGCPTETLKVLGGLEGKSVQSPRNPLSTDAPSRQTLLRTPPIWTHTPSPCSLTGTQTLAASTSISHGPLHSCRRHRACGPRPRPPRAPHAATFLSDKERLALATTCKYVVGSDARIVAMVASLGSPSHHAALHTGPSAPRTWPSSPASPTAPSTASSPSAGRAPPTPGSLKPSSGSMPARTARPRCRGSLVRT